MPRTTFGTATEFIESPEWKMIDDKLFEIRAEYQEEANNFILSDDHAQAAALVGRIQMIDDLAQIIQGVFDAKQSNEETT